MVKKSQFLLKGLTLEQKKFLKQYALEKTGKHSVTQGLLALVNEAMNQSSIKAMVFEEPKEYLKEKQRVQLSLFRHDYEKLEELAKNTDSSIQHYIKCLIRNNLYGKYELLGYEMEALRKSNYELHRLGVNINQIAKSINAGKHVTFDIKRTANFIKNHTDKVEGILKENLSRF